MGGSRHHRVALPPLAALVCEMEANVRCAQSLSLLSVIEARSEEIAR
jgi:hypothetical protein